MYVQSTSVWSRGRYLMPCDSSSCSTSSGIRPFTVIAYIPRAYLSIHVEQSGGKRKDYTTYLFFANVPPSSSPGQRPRQTHRNVSSCRLGYDLENPSSKIGVNGQAKTLRSNVGRMDYLHDFLAVRTAVAPEVYGRLYNRAEETCAQVL